MKRLIVAISLIAISGCAFASPLSVEAAIYEGLDGVVVAEVLDNPVARQKIEDEPISTRASMAQGIVINFILCRDALRVYLEWVDTGVAPTLEPLPTPTNPAEPSFSSIDDYYAHFEASARSGEVEQLRQTLTSDGSCGQWIPAFPGVSDGPTVKGVVEAAS